MTTYIITLIGVKIEKTTKACFTVVSSDGKLNGYFELNIGESMSVEGNFYPHTDNQLKEERK